VRSDARVSRVGRVRRHQRVDKALWGERRNRECRVD
jgi:hypothetical protein